MDVPFSFVDKSLRASFNLPSNMHELSIRAAGVVAAVVAAMLVLLNFDVG